MLGSVKVHLICEGRGGRTHRSAEDRCEGSRLASGFPAAWKALLSGARQVTFGVVLRVSHRFVLFRALSSDDSDAARPRMVFEHGIGGLMTLDKVNDQPGSPILADVVDGCPLTCR